MFIINFEFIKPIEEVNNFTEAHRNYVAEQYKQGKFIIGGPKQPRSGGVVIANCASVDEVNNILNNDPLIKEQVATYELIEFKPLMSEAKLAHYIS